MPPRPPHCGRPCLSSLHEKRLRPTAGNLSISTRKTIKLILQRKKKLRNPRRKFKPTAQMSEMMIAVPSAVEAFVEAADSVVAAPTTGKIIDKTPPMINLPVDAETTVEEEENLDLTKLRPVWLVKEITKHPDATLGVTRKLTRENCSSSLLTLFRRNFVSIVWNRITQDGNVIPRMKVLDVHADQE